MPPTCTRDSPAVFSGAWPGAAPAGGQGVGQAGRRKGGPRADRSDRGERSEPRGERSERSEREPGPNSYAMSAVDALFGRASREARLATLRNAALDEESDIPEREPGPNSYAMSAVDALFGKSGGGGGRARGPRSAERSSRKGARKGGSQPDPTRSALGVAPGQPRYPGAAAKRRNHSR